MPRNWPPVAVRPGPVPGRRDRTPAGLGEMNQRNLLSALVKIGSLGACRWRGQDTWLLGAGGRLTGQAKEMSRDHDDARHAVQTRKATAAAVSAGTVLPVSKNGLVVLEEQIDECLIAARMLDPEGLESIIQHLRRARNEVVWKIGQ